MLNDDYKHNTFTDEMAVQLRVCCNETHLTSDLVLSFVIQSADLSFVCYNDELKVSYG